MSGTWTNIPDADVDTDSFGKEDVVFQRLRDNIRASRQALIYTDEAEASTTSTTYVTAFSVPVFIPDVADHDGLTRKYIQELSVRVSAGTGTYRIQDNASGNVGPEITSVATIYEEKDAEIDVQSSWKGTRRIFDFQQKINSGANTAFVKADARITGRLDY